MFKFKNKIQGQTVNNDTKDINIVVQLQYLSNSLRTVYFLINCEINLILICSANHFLVAGNVAYQLPTFTILNRKLHVLLITLSTQDNGKLLEQLKIGFERIIIWNRYQSKITMQAHQYLDYLADPSFQGVNRLFVLSYGNTRHWTCYK